MHPLIVYYSRTGNTHEITRLIASEVASPTVERIRPRTQRRYANWLLRSFVPGSRVPIRPVETDPTRYDVVFLGTPKWTLSCPPINEYLAHTDLDGVTVGLFITYGGFDEERYLDRLVERLQAQGASVPATLRVKRDQIDTDECASRVAEFCELVTDA